jgi:hypothetical protein
MDTQALTGRLAAVNPGKILVFVGSGLVREVGYPSWAEFLSKGVEFVRTHSSEVAATMNARISRNQLIAAGNCFFEPEVPAGDFHNFLRREFDKNPPIPTTLKRFLSCPFAEFITCNFDRTIEQAIALSTKTPEVFADGSRLRRFNSRLSVYAESSEIRTHNGLVLKLHGDVGSPENTVLSTHQFESLKADESYVFLLKHLLSSYTIVFVGFSGRDPNFLWHCETLVEVCGSPVWTSYLLHPDDEPPSETVQKANVIAIGYSTTENHKQLRDFIGGLTDIFSKPDALRIPHIIEPIPDSSRDTLAFLCAGLSSGAHVSSYHCAIVSMVAKAADAVGGIDIQDKVIQQMARMYHISVSDANRIYEQADRGSVIRSLESIEAARTRFDRLLKALRDGVAKRSKAFGRQFQKSEQTYDRIVAPVLVSALSKAGSGLALSLVDSEAPESSIIDKTLREAIDQLSVPGIGPLDKEVLKSAFADMFMRPTREEGQAISSLAQAAVASSLAVTFSGGMNKILELMPSEAYLDANVAIPLVAPDHPRSSGYLDLVVGLSKIHCDTFLLDVFLEEMVHHCKLASIEMNQARIRNRSQAKDYAEYHSPLGINAFLAAYAAGAKDRETFPGYLDRMFKSSRPTANLFRRAIEKLGIEVVPTRLLDKSPSDPLAVEIASEKSKLNKIKAQVLAQHEAVQILWIHKERSNRNVWFVTEDSALRRILRAMRSLPFSQDPPSRGVMPAYGAHLLISSLSERPSLEANFAQILWNPAYLEQIDTMLSSVLKRFLSKMKELKDLDILKLRDKASAIIQKEMVRTEKDAIRRRANEFLQGQPQILESVLREIGEA